MMRFIAHIILPLFAMLPICVNGQLVASVKQIDFGNLDQSASEIISLPISNFTSKDIRCVSGTEHNQLTTQISTHIKSSETGEIQFQLKDRKLKRINETIYIQTEKFNEPVEVRIKAKVVGWDKAKCPEFEVKSVKYKVPKNKDKTTKFEGIQLYEKKDRNRFLSESPEDVPYGHVVFLLDASVSMKSNQKWKILKKQLSAMINELRPMDHVSVLLYNHESTILIDNKPCSDKEALLDEVSAIKPSGFTNGQRGVVNAVDHAEMNHSSAQNTHIILMTDGAFNFGDQSNEIGKWVAQKREIQSFKMSVISVSGMQDHAEDLKNLSKSGGGHFFKIDNKSAEIKKVKRMLKIQMS